MEWDDITQEQIDRLVEQIGLGNTQMADRVCVHCQFQYPIELHRCPECQSENSFLVKRNITKEDLATSTLMSAVLRVSVSRHPAILYVATSCDRHVDRDVEVAEVTIEKLNGAWLSAYAEYDHFADEVHNMMRAESRALVLCAVDAANKGWFDTTNESN